MKRNSMYEIFHTPFGSYLYDARINRIEFISDDLGKMIDGAEAEQLEKNEEYMKLKEKGFFKKSEFKIYSENVEFLTVIYGRLLHNITLQVTQNCNFRCSYCPYTDNNGSNRLHTQKTMSLETAYKAIDFLHTHSMDANDISIGFYGGEPLLVFPLIQRIMEYAKKNFLGKKLTFQLTTNATLLTPEILEYFENNNINLTISLDGPKTVNDVHRVFALNNKSVFDVVEQKLQIIIEKYPKLKLRTNINMVMDPSLSYDKYDEIYNDECIAEKYYITPQIVDSSDLNKEYAASEDFVAHIQYFNFIEMLLQNKLLKREEIHKHVSTMFAISKANTFKAFKMPEIDTVGYPAGPCRPGYNKMFVNVDGDILLCEKVSENNNAMCIGNIYSGINIEKCIELMKIPLLTEEECKSCWCFRLCDSCFVYACDNDGLSREKRLLHCAYAQNSAYETVLRYIVENRKVLGNRG